MSDRDGSPRPGAHTRRGAKQSAGHLEPEMQAGTSFNPGDADMGRNSFNSPDPASPSMQTAPDDIGIIQPKARRTHIPSDDERRHSKGGHRPHKHRSSGAFLLSDPLSNDSPRDLRTRSYTRDRYTAESHGERQASHTPEIPHSGALYVGDEQSLASEGTPPRTGRPSESISVANRNSSASRSTSGGAPPGSSATPMDLDSTQIVNMALSLSETRRLASRRNVTHHVSPRLEHLPNQAAGGSLRQHLQQQRRISGRASPKPGALARAQKLNSPLQPSFDLGHEGSYRYHFSKSSLSRAQKAKDYLELLAQHRRLLDLVPPLESNQAARLSLASRPTTPSGSAQGFTHTTADMGGPLGRPYNPLQYIRNRKVRARERQAIDSEAQGFNDVLRVTEWVDEAARSAVSESGTLPWNGLPSFHTADEATAESSPPSNSTKTSLPASKPKRPRVDWVIDPADMIADLYWLEQGDHKMLVEDRQWRRVFPQDPELYRPLSRQTDDSAPVTSQTSPAPEPSSTTAPPDPKISDPKATKAEHEHVLSSARERAQQKLHALRGLHHRHSSSVHNYEFLRNRRGSLSDTSVTDDERRQRSRSGTIASSGKDILEKQMMEMIAREKREEELNGRRDTRAAPQQPLPGETMSPEEGTAVPSTMFNRPPSHKRQNSIAEASETERKYRKLKQRPSSPQHHSRASLEVPRSGRRPSFDYDSSAPNSPDMRPTRSNPFVPAIGMDLTPASSRPSSPNRKPFSKVKRIFRDRSRERGADSPRYGKEDSPDINQGHEMTHEPLSMEKPRTQSPQRDSRSPVRKVTSRGTDGSHKSHWSISSTKYRGDEAGPGIRGMLKGPRIDSVLRSGVSKVGDLLWRKESEAQSSGPSSDESELEPARGLTDKQAITSRTPSQRRNGASSQHNGKSYLAIMPSFAPSSESHVNLGGDQDSLAASGPPSRPPSRRSPRFDRLKPPRIDVQTTPTKTTPPGPSIRFPQDPDASDAESRKSSYAEAVRAADARLHAALTLPRQRKFSTAAGANRCWSISDRATSQASAPFSRAEIARLRALVLSSGIMAMEIDRRAKTRRLLGDPNRADDEGSSQGGGSPADHPAVVTWNTIAGFAPNAHTRADILSRPTAPTESYPLAAQILGASVQGAGEEWRDAAEAFAAETSPALRGRVESLREKVRDQSEMTRAAADEADELSRDLAVGQRLQVKRVVDVIEKMLRRRRRRFRWLRRAGWLALEWVLVGFMWYVWFVVMIARVFFGVGKGVVRGVRWLLWL